MDDSIHRDEGQFLDRIRDRIRSLSAEKQELLELRMSQAEMGRDEAPAQHDAASGGDLRLAAYLVLNNDSPSSEEQLTSELRRFLGDSLPAYMIPDQWVVLDRLPLTPNGKVDRQALPDPQAVRSARPKKAGAPEDEVERTVVQVWKSVLRMEEIDSWDNFFELGGHSLLVTRMLAQLGELFAVDIPVQSFFQAPTAADLAQLISALRLAARAYDSQGVQPSGPRETFEL